MSEECTEKSLGYSRDIKGYSDGLGRLAESHTVILQCFPSPIQSHPDSTQASYENLGNDDTI